MQSILQLNSGRKEVTEFMLTTRHAQALISAAEDKANSMNVSVNIAVLDNGAYLKAFLRMDGAVLGSIDVATRKARTVR